METKYESNIKVVKNSAEAIYSRLADFTRLGVAIPQDKIKNWTATPDSCHFTVDQIGDMGLRIADRQLNSLVKYTADGETRFNFNLWVQMKEAAPYDSRIKVTLKADINVMIKTMFGSKLQQFVDSLAESIALNM